MLVRVLARLHEEAKLYKKVREWLGAIDLHDRFYIKPVEHEFGRGFGATEAARGALADWIVLENGKIANYQIITPTAWNIGPRDSQNVDGPMEQAYIGTTIHDPSDPVELGHVARSFNSCLVCTVHAYNSKTGKEIGVYRIGETG